jgi:hypothetical protein
VYMCVESLSRSLDHSLSLSLSSLSEIKIIQGLFLGKCQQSICEDVISNLSRSFSFGRNENSFDTIILGSKFLGSTKSQ